MAISPQQLTIYLYSAHRAVMFAIAQLSCLNMLTAGKTILNNLHVMTNIHVRPIHVCIGPCEFSKDTFFGFIISANILFLLL